MVGLHKTDRELMRERTNELLAEIRQRTRRVPEGFSKWGQMETLRYKEACSQAAKLLKRERPNVAELNECATKLRAFC